MNANRKRLTSEQQQVIRHQGSLALVKAVPGSGKTATLVMRVVYLLKLGVIPSEIVILMYNKSAVQEFENRLSIAINGQYPMPVVRTFHSLALEILTSAEKSGLLGKHKLITPQSHEYRECIRQAFNDHDGPSLETKLDLETVELHLARFFAEGLSPDEVESDPLLGRHDKRILGAYRHFWGLLKARRFRTFDSSLVEVNQFLSSSPASVAHLRHVIIDEYQDINFIQHEMILNIAGSHAHVMAVGDINQSIYRWRGSRPDFIAGLFVSHFPSTKVFNLSCTFRFGHSLSLIANSLIGKNTQRHSQICVSHPTKSPVTDIYLHPGLCLSKISSLLSKPEQTSAILARTNADLAEAELALRLQRLPYSYTSNDGATTDKRIQSKLFTRPEICALICIFLIGVDGNLQRLVNHPLQRVIISGFLNACGIAWVKGQRAMVMNDLLSANNDPCVTLSQAYINGRKQEADIQRFLGLQNHINPDTPASELYRYLTKNSFFGCVPHSFVTRRESNDQERIEVRITAIFSSTKLTVRELLDAMLNPPTTSNHTNSTQLATFHTAKGLEFDNVIIIGLSDDEFPVVNRQEQLSRSKKGPAAPVDEELEEERRLFYVGITRAKKELHLIIPDDPQLSHWLDKGWNSTPRTRPQASRFVYELGLTMCTQVSQAIYNPALANIMPINNLSSWYLRSLKSLEKMI